MIHPAMMPDEELLAECHIEFMRRSGPGGQHRNKTETAVILRHIPTGITAEANECRSQADNRRTALFRLRLFLAVRVRTVANIDNQVTARWSSRVIGKRLAIASEHRDFPALLAEALNRFQRNDWVLDATAGELGVSGSQLVKLLKLHHPALELVNQARAALQLPLLR